MPERPPPVPVDLLLHGASEVATPEGTAPLGGPAMGRIRVHAAAGGVAVAVDGGRVVAVGDEASLRAAWAPRRELDARGGTVVPGFVDAHTHPVFATTREDEFEMRTRGATYVEIAAAGGGILSTLQGVRGSSESELAEGLALRLDRFLELGTTTIEAKSGYGLSVEDELKSLRAIRAADAEHPLELVPTFLGAHTVPGEFDGRADDYVALVIDEMLPRVAEAKLASYCDVFTETTAFDLDQSRRILLRARELGMGLRLHVDQLTPMGGAELAAELGAATADHLECVTDAGIEALSAAGVLPVLCPLVALYLRQEDEAPGRRLVDAGLAPAISTDFNPGSCYAMSMPEVLSWAALRYRLSAGEALTAATLNAACSIGRGADLGTVEPGKQADLVVLDVPNHRHLTYELGRNPVRAVVKSGRVVLERPVFSAGRR